MTRRFDRYSFDPATQTLETVASNGLHAAPRVTLSRYGRTVSTDFEYDPLGNRTLLATSRDGGATWVGTSSEYGADGLESRRVRSDGSSVSFARDGAEFTCGAAVCSLAYSHDRLGRVTARDGGAFGYNPRSEVVSASVGTNLFAYAYDSAGNALFASRNADFTAFDGFSLWWDAPGRLRTVTGGDGGTRYCEYDWAGRLPVPLLDQVLRRRDRLLLLRPPLLLARPPPLALRRPRRGKRRPEPLRLLRERPRERRGLSGNVEGHIGIIRETQKSL